MSQINFRVDEDTKEIISLISSTEGINIAELAKRATFKEISKVRVDIAFALLSTGKIGRKKTWKIFRLSCHPMNFLMNGPKEGQKKR